MTTFTLLRGLVPLGALLLGSASTAFAGEDISVSVSTDYVSEYVFRGVTLAGEAFQPGAEISVGNFSAGVWASLASGEESVFFGDEIDIYAGYGFDLSDSISASAGVTLYHYPQLGGLFDIGANEAGTLEVNAGLGFDAPLSPAITAYYDFTLKAFTLEGGAEYSLPLAEKTSFDLAASAGLVTVDGGGDYQYGSASAALSYAFTDTTAAYIGANAGVSSEDTFSDTSFDPLDVTSIDAPKGSSLWFGIGVSSGF